jgi:hypothetical protein
MADGSTPEYRVTIPAKEDVVDLCASHAVKHGTSTRLI